VHIEIPTEAEFFIILPQIAKRKIDNYGKEYKSKKNKYVEHALPLQA
jgi:hypothetical protein